MKRKSKTGRKSYHLPSKVAVEARQQTGAGTHNKQLTRAEAERAALEEHFDVLETDFVYEEILEDTHTRKESP